MKCPLIIRGTAGRLAFAGSMFNSIPTSVPHIRLD